MNHIKTFAVKQPKSVTARENLICDLQRAKAVINAEYQQIDWEDVAFLNSVLTKTIENLEESEEISNAYN